MVKLDLKRWGTTPENLRERALTSPHGRTRERFLALYQIATNDSCATSISREVGRHLQTVLSWVHAFNEAGPDGLVYRRSGARPPFSPQSGRSSKQR
jgi:hypothetical protein